MNEHAEQEQRIESQTSEMTRSERIAAAVDAAARRAADIVDDRAAIVTEAALFENNFRLAREIGRLCGIDPGDAFFRTFVRNELRDEPLSLHAVVERLFFARRRAIATTVAIGDAMCRLVLEGTRDSVRDDRCTSAPSLDVALAAA